MHYYQQDVYCIFLLLICKLVSEGVAEPNGIAFHATLGTNQGFAPGSILKYDVVRVNEGHGYDPKTGIYTSPTSGLYVFVWETELDFDRQSIRTLLKVNQAVVSKQWVKTSAGDMDIPGTSLAILQLNAGDQVYVEVQIDSGGPLASPYTKFSGWMIT